MIKVRPLLLFVLLITAIPSVIFPQMPPHPELAAKIKKGEIEKPFTLKNLKAIRSRGVDAPWSSAELKLNKSASEAGRIYGSAQKVTGEFRALVILVDFPNKVSRSRATLFDTLLFSRDQGSLNHYYREISYGKVDIVTANLPGDLGWKRAPQIYSYYVDGQNGFGTYPRNAQKLVEDAIALVDPEVDFSLYDNDKDGEVDALFIVHSGPGAEYTADDNDIWSHAWSVANTQFRDGVKVARYSMEPEYWNFPGDMTVGVYAHELGHAGFGLPDLYDTDYSSEGLGDWSLMAGGSWNGANGNVPAHPDAWSRIQMGFLTPVNITDSYSKLEIPSVRDTAVAYRIWKKGGAGAEYFLLENRQLKGYDSGLPGEGLMLYHVDETAYSNDNEWYPGHASSGNYLVALEQADGMWQLEKGGSTGDMYDPFPGPDNKTEFSSSTLPNTKGYRSGYSYVAIRNISPSAGIMTAEVDLNDNLLISSPAFVFKPTDINGPGDTLVINLTNILAGSLSVNVENRGTDFRIINKNSFPAAVSAMDSIKLIVNFDPLSRGTVTDSIKIIMPGIDNPRYLSLTGKAFKIEPASENVLYTFSAASQKGNFLTLSASNGAGSNIGVPGISTVKSLAIAPATKELYALTQELTKSNLLRVNAAEGDAYEICKTSVILSAIAFDNGGNLWGAGKNKVLYRVDPKTGQCVQIRNIGMTVSDMKFNPADNKLWLSAGAGAPLKDLIFRLDVATGDTVHTGRTGLPSYLEGMAFNRQGELFGIYSGTDQGGKVVKINTSNGAAAEIGPAGYVKVKGMAMVSSDFWASAKEEKTVPSVYSLEQNYPNPFNPSTTIDFSLPQKGFVEVNIFDLLGRKVASLVNGEMPAGRNRIKFNAAGLPSGLYIYSMRSGNFSQSRKMMLLK